ncbi:unnamed protein product [Rotaria socialis]|uniref:Cyclin-dependent kinase 7 n=1 Tax=Rotaria socialis TaxID=392032 RepID=A0A820DMC6_9BILA|nr:unnamed protein product [Rotaria socialis]CAF3344428.1 unnamed protein product [Rotaria socialis]CAF3347469.1 unnamed protein product [Rotaria socialis]CAF3443262.1 unnamed protein product [Rotaria socialis]CAF3747672.1 unnamed protein product [Rotaria socialis]
MSTKMRRYDFIKVLGEGQYAVVYKAKDTRTNDDVAVKKIKIGSRQEASDGINLTALREIKFLQEVKHPNVIELLDSFGEYGSNSPSICLVFEFMSTDLENIINNRSILLTTTHTKSYMIMLLLGLEYLHNNWILHRDLKPNNLLIDKHGVLKIADFGLAKFFGSPSRLMSHEVVTRWYRSPELLFGAKKYGTAVDMWAAGLIMAELLLRTPLLPGESDLGQLLKIFEVFGTPTDSNWPDVRAFSNYIEYKSIEPKPLRTIFTTSKPDELDVLDRIMQLDPKRRPNASDTLQMEYFSNPPAPCPSERLPKPQGIIQQSDPLKRKLGNEDKVTLKKERP